MAGALVYGRETHNWFEQISVPRKESDTKEGPRWEFRQRMNSQITVHDKKITFKSDRPKVEFLGRQSKLLKLI